MSRLSTSAFQSRELSLDEVSKHLRADYVVSGSYHVDGDRLMLKAELAETRTGQVVWSQTLRGNLSAYVAGDDPLPSLSSPRPAAADDGAGTATVARYRRRQTPAEPHAAAERHYADAPHLAARL